MNNDQSGGILFPFMGTACVIVNLQRVVSMFSSYFLIVLLFFLGVGGAVRFLVVGTIG